MKTFAIALGAVTLAILLVAVGVWLGASVIRNDWGYGMMGSGMRGPGMMGGWLNSNPSNSGDQAPCGNGWNMMGNTCGGTFGRAAGEPVADLKEAHQAVEDYLAQLGYTDLNVTEVMEFERNFYTIVAEDDTGIGAMELLVDASTGAVGPEPGPNMMWNAKYGMMGSGGAMMGMMRNPATDEMTLSPTEAEEVAQRWLDANLPGRAAGEADPFYGYYTLHFMNNGEIEGMLSVHGSSGDIWYHSWHGDFFAMVGEHDG